MTVEELHRTRADGVTLASIEDCYSESDVAFAAEEPDAEAALLRLRAPGCAVLSINELPAAQPIEVIAIVGGEDALPQPTGPVEALDHQREPLAA